MVSSIYGERLKGSSCMSATYHYDDEIEPTPGVGEIDFESKCQEFD